jgi:hypothetical protein
VEWETDPVAVTAESALAAESADADEQAERQECDRWLRNTLTTGPIPQPEIEASGRDAGFSLSALKRAKSRIGARSYREGFGKGSKCYWTLSPDVPIEFTWSP